MARKGISVWVLSSLTLMALVHFVESISVLIFNNQIKLLEIYPLIGERLQSVAPALYFWGSLVTVLVLWGITCLIAFDNPVEVFLNRVISDAKEQSASETQLVKEKGDLLDIMNETLIANSILLGETKDIALNIRGHVRTIQTVEEIMNRIETQLGSVKMEIDSPLKCPTCEKPILPEFKVCPYCSENIKLLPQSTIPIKSHVTQQKCQVGK